MYKTVASKAQAEFTEKRSRFIGYTSPAETEDDALAFIKSVTESNRGAEHNVYAYSLRGAIRFNDDGEPQGTAGMPVLDVIQREGLTGVVIVVTRYFGGILLGAGGLTRAYSRAAKDAINAAGIVTMTLHDVIQIICGYTHYKKICGIITASGGVVSDTQFTDCVTINALIKAESSKELQNEVFDTTSGNAIIETLQKVYHGEKI